MLAYLGVYFFIIFALFLNYMYKTKYFIYFTFVLLLLFSSLRFEVGADYLVYYDMFIDFKKNIALFDFEPLNMLIINSVNFSDINVYFIFFIYSFLILCGIYYFIFKLSLSKEISIILFFLIGIFYLSTLNGIRQWAAISMILVAIVNIINKQNFRGFFFIFLAMMFHSSAIVLFVLFFLKRKFKLTTLLIILIIVVIVSGFLVDAITNTGYRRYLIEGLYTQSVNLILLSIYIFSLMIFPFLFKYFNKNVELSNKMVFLLNMNFVSVLILVIGYILELSMISIMRINMYFQLQIIILIPEFLLIIKNKYIRFLLQYLMILVLSIYFFYTLFVNGELYKLVPYNTYLG
ncbi:EpsG family protein [Arcobacter defluvii]|uniref:Glycosyltransferase, EpsG family n=1 Tax=Arcobacter defluvii TaxID=873191 RepID=A0AAE7BCH7_9BACT|nr:EpsG family protein [Arcobacter defluvii]QKF76875.1 glycosyltransferase, EpsG family [Arcobacter defluvii]RXI33787.1 hypothetical protein CP964_05065 [Arcobacter defluvii]